MAPKNSAPDASQRTLFGFFQKRDGAVAAATAASSSSNGNATPSSIRNTPKTPINVLDSDEIAPEGDTTAASSSVGRARLSNAKLSTPPTSEPATTAMLINEGVKAEQSQSEGEEELMKARKLLSKAKPKRKVAIQDSEDEEAAATSSQPVTKKAKVAKSNGNFGKSKAKGKTTAADEDDFIVPDAASSSDEFDSGPNDIDFGSVDLDQIEADAQKSVEKRQKEKAKAKTNESSDRLKPSSSMMQRKLSGNSNSSTGGATRRLESNRKQLEQKKKAANADMFDFLREIRDADKHPIGHPEYDPRTLYIPQSAWSKMTPFEVQFWKIKQKHYDTVLFFQKGKFYELYEDDATIGHQEFDLKLTDRVKMRMVGVPEAQFESWASKFLARGYKVGRVDQSETALGAEMRKRDAKAGGGKDDKIVGRELKSVYTKATLTEGLVEDMGNHCVSIKEHLESAHALPSFGLCVLDAATAEFNLAAFQDDISRTKLGTILRHLRPKEIIHEKANLSPATTRIMKSVLSNDCRWTSLRSGTEYLSADDALEAVSSLLLGEDDENSMNVDKQLPQAIAKLKDNEQAMSALGGMVYYLKSLNLDNDLCRVGNFNIYDMHRGGMCMILDGFTLQHIEVLQNSMGTDEGTLLKLLNRCTTPSGKRLFKIWLCQPLCDAEGINARLDAVEDLMANPSVRDAFKTISKGALDLERVLSRIHAGTCKASLFVKACAALKTLNRMFVTLSGECDNLKSKSLVELIQSAPEFESKIEDVEGRFTDEEGILVPLEGADEEYDANIESLAEVEEKLQSTLKKYKKELGVSSIQFKDIGTKDIYQVEVAKGTSVPDDWRRMSGTQKLDRFYTPRVEKLVRDLKELRETRSALRNGFQAKLYAHFSQDYRLYLSAVKASAELDCLLSLAASSSSLGEPAVRPEIAESEEAFVDFKELRHPCLLSSSVDFIPNDVRLGGKAPKVDLITGPNMSGKSTLLRMTAAAVIMAQLGCYVPASSARISPVDRICTRMGANDFIFANASTFKVEMDDCKKILTEATPKSLVILDELGRGTSTFDGLAIAFAVLQDLATYKNCIAFFSTHYNSLVDDFAYHSQVKPCHMSSMVVDGEMTFLYKLVTGATAKSYGPHVAKLAGVPEAIVQRASDLSANFEKDTRARQLDLRRDEQLLPLSFQHDLIFLAKVARKEPVDIARLLSSLSVIRKNIEKL